MQYIIEKYGEVLISCLCIMVGIGMLGACILFCNDVTSQQFNSLFFK
ncbi:MAG: hypothetical protein Q4F06_03460 [Eubacteriales bacterium]|nr:hypothetical protein [Eubacteriales bacterium]